MKKIGKNGNILDEVLYKIKKIIGIKNFNDTEILIDKDNKLPLDITLKSDVILVACVTEDDNKFYQQLPLEEELAV